MSYAEQSPTLRPMSQQASSLAHEWRRLGRAATVVAVLTSPALFFVFYVGNGWSVLVSLIVTFVAIIAFRGLVDVIAHKLIPAPNLYGAGREMLAQDVVDRRRVWYWRTRFRRLIYLFIAFTFVTVLLNLLLRLGGEDPGGIANTWSAFGPLFVQFLPQMFILMLQLPLFFLFNFLIFFGPLLFFGIKQMKGYEPGDADWGVKLADVRGQAEPKEEVTRVISLWQSGEEFEKSGGKRERGLLFLGAPGTGKTMLSKAIATSFNSPFVTIPGSGFAQTFIGMDVVVVMFLISKARRLARKWGGQCIVFIDEIDAVGMRRQALGGIGGAGGIAEPVEGPRLVPRPSLLRAHGRAHADGRPHPRDPSVARAAVRGAGSEGGSIYPPALPGWAEHVQGFMFPGMGGMGGGLALNQLLVQMDGVDDPPFTRKFFTNRVNTFLDATYVIPQRIGKRALRIRPPKPRAEQIYFIGATNVPIDVLDPALSARAAWAGTSGSARRPRTTARTSSSCTWPRSITSPTWTPTAAATSSPASPTATRRP